MALLGGGWSIAADNKNQDSTPPASVPKTPAPELTPEQRQAKRKEMVAKREARLKELKAKKAAGTLSEKEEKQLTRLEQAGRPGSGRKGPKPESETK